MILRGAFLIAGLTIASPLWAHPGVGIVKDQRGYVFYTDLAQIWQIDPEGRRSIAVPGVHTHELAVDGEGNLVGEEVRGAGGGWQHRIWRRTPDGRIADLVPWTDGFWQDDGLTRDETGNRYWVVCPDRQCVMRKREPNGRAATLARAAQFRYTINWIVVGPAGVVYFPDGPDLRRLDATGRMSTLVAGLGPPDNQNALMGLRIGADGAIYIAVPARRAIMRVTPDGRSSVAASSRSPWAPSGVLPDTDGSFWILEFDVDNRVRVRRILPNGDERVY
ncbi:MAG TPA: hypothetical protein VL225_00465 [Vicinamibacterales bacterium]|jgi:hypothetical protein|nr:hypothetical protein [Vicinamibacterales bacterium]